MADGDPVRLLHRRSELAYTDRADLGLLDEPEAISVETQKAISERSRRVWVERQRSAWAEANGKVDAALGELLAVVGHDHRAESTARAIRRGMQQLGERIASSS